MAPPASKARFLSTLRTDRVSLTSADRILLAPLAFSSALLDRLVIVPEGFVTDFASVPRAPLTYWLFGGVGDEAAVVHDFLYERGLVPREQADDVYLEALEACGVANWRRLAMWAAVRAFGSSRYTGNAPQGA
jgi:hypothetical protein